MSDYDILTEDGNVLVTESGDTLVTGDYVPSSSSTRGRAVTFRVNDFWRKYYFFYRREHFKHKKRR